MHTFVELSRGSYKEQDSNVCSSFAIAGHGALRGTCVCPFRRMSERDERKRERGKFPVGIGNVGQEFLGVGLRDIEVNGFERNVGENM